MPVSDLKPGDPAPDFELPADDGPTVKLSDFRGKRVVLYFYPKDDTSGCTTQACGFRDVFPSIEEKNAVVLGVSPDSAQVPREVQDQVQPAVHSCSPTRTTPSPRRTESGRRSPTTARRTSASSGATSSIDENGRLADAQVKVSPTDSVEKAVAALS